MASATAAAFDGDPIATDRQTPLSRATRSVIRICICLLSIAPTWAADLAASKAEDGSNVIRLSGEIKLGDAQKFKQLATNPGNTTIYLDSHGGLVQEGILIGTLIHTKGYATAVPDGSICASACGLIWLAGTTRYIGAQGRVGFHAAYTSSGNDVKESGVANALIGRYLTRLGLSDEAVIFTTLAPPDEIRWLNASDARKIGVQYSLLSQPKQNRSDQSIVEAPKTAIPFLACMSLVASVYHLPPRVLPGIQAVEDGRVGLEHLKKDGSVDLGVMQINTRWVAPIARFTKLPEFNVRDRLLYDPCFNIAAAGLILRTYLNERKGDLMLAVGDYHSHRPPLNLEYQAKVLNAVRRMFTTGSEEGLNGQETSSGSSGASIDDGERQPVNTTGTLGWLLRLLWPR
jgi:hypothetical protein